MTDNNDESEVISHKYSNLPKDILDILDDLLHYRVDSDNEYYNVTMEDIMKKIQHVNTRAVIAADVEKDPNKLKGRQYDPYLQSFVLGCGGQLTHFSKIEDSMIPVAIRGIAKYKYIEHYKKIGRDFYFIDTGYFGNGRKKLYHRITKNDLQNLGPVIERPTDRLRTTGIKPKKFTKGSSILICPPSDKVMSCYGLDSKQWLDDTIAKIKLHSDRPIIVREKPSRKDRVTTNSIEMALDDDVHCLVTYNSIAATEAILHGKPAFTLGPNAAQSMCLDDLSRIETPYYPTLDQVSSWAAHLSYCQFTEDEMRNSTAWRILNDL